MRRDQIEELFYGKADQQRRFTQDFPILPDVWMKYAEDPAAPVELLLTPHNYFNAPTVARELRARLKQDDAARPDLPAVAKSDAASPRPARRVLFNESVVLARLTLPELLRCAMPLTDWWKRTVAPLELVWMRENLRDTAGWLERLEASPNGKRTDPKLLQKLIRIVGCLEIERRGGAASADDLTSPKLSTAEVEAFADLYHGLLAIEPSAAGVLWSLSLNREANTSVWRSRLTVKADAADRVFETRTSGIRWAVLDTGIDARHPAFRKRNGGVAEAPVGGDPADGIRSRVVRTYNFLAIKDLLDPDIELPIEGTLAQTLDSEKLREAREDLHVSLERGRAIDWDLLEPFLRVSHEPSKYQPPITDSHGTHVAGILAANWPEAATTTPVGQVIKGICPDMEIYDMRVLPDGELGPKADEFTIIAALQFVRYLNAHKDLMVVHGVNLSLSVRHDVANYACGRTPVCEECERVVNSGVVVVAAAGNRGFNKTADTAGGASGDYRYISITDPGNADAVITVGSTHRMLPHNYGVSYFSSRGPTGDGRTKPDLVAPGERIDSASLGDNFETMDGTSMAAPHVSGAAALLMSRHRELVGQPLRIKKILCDTATDLGREPRFQGHGMIDVLRAIQSI
jgi:serine protease AprX